MKTNSRINLHMLSAFIVLLSTVTTTALAQCQAAFTFTVGSAGQVTFSNASTGTGILTDYNWYFGDATAGSQQQNPSHTYAYNGTYTAQLSINDSLNGGGCSSTYTAAIVINNTANCNLSVSYSYSVGANGVVSFTNTSTGINPGMIVSWNFGDGTSSSSMSPTHAYTYNGVYGSSLSITDSLGICTGSQWDTVMINTAQNPPSCNTSFTYTRNVSGNVSFSASLNGTLTQPQISWDFGDGQHAYGTLSPSHTYAYNGIYNVYLYVTDSVNSNYGCSYYQRDTIVNTAQGPCNDSLFFTVVPDTSQPGVWNVVLYSNDLNGLVNATWSWGDGTSATGIYPSHTYASPGMYSICVSAAFACGDSVMFCQNDSVYRSSLQMITVHVINSATGIRSNEESITSFRAYPNPFSDELTMSFTSEESKEIKCTILDMMGNLVLSQNASVTKGKNDVKFKTADLAKGVYFVRLNNSRTFKVIK